MKMINLFCSIGNDVDSFESIEFKNDAITYKSRGSLTAKTFSPSENLLNEIYQILNSNTLKNYIDPNIGINPTPGERYYDTRDFFFLRVPSLNLEIKIYIDSAQTESLCNLISLFISIFQEAQKT
ncbi:MAG: hypothetical protein AB7I27_00120 [Bacteriovoracaceae bacterium]